MQPVPIKPFSAKKFQLKIKEKCRMSSDFFAHPFFGDLIRLNTPRRTGLRFLRLSDAILKR